MELHSAWFSTLAAPLGDGEETDITAYLAGLGFTPPQRPLRVASRSPAAAITRTPAQSWWDAEEAERARLERTARVESGDRDSFALADTLLRAAVVAAACSGGTDQALIRVAAGAATYAAYPYLHGRPAPGMTIRSCENTRSLRAGGGRRDCTATASRSFESGSSTARAHGGGHGGRSAATVPTAKRRHRRRG